VWWDYAQHGLCLSRKTAQNLHIQNDMQTLYQYGKLRCSVLEKMGYDMQVLKKLD